MRLLGFLWLTGGLMGAFLIAWLMPVAGLHFIIHALSIFGGNIAITYLAELVLLGIFGPNKS